jgi:hypothetical protein
MRAGVEAGLVQTSLGESQIWDSQDRAVMCLTTPDTCLPPVLVPEHKTMTM